MGIQRSSFYYWRQTLINPSDKVKNLNSNILLFEMYHKKFPSHGYRWLNAKIRLDLGLVLSDPYAHKCCKLAGIKSKSKHYNYRKPGEERRVFPNLLLTTLNIDGPMQCVVSDMTVFSIRGYYYELTLFMDLWNNEIIAHSLSSKRGDRLTYLSGLKDLLEFKKLYPDQEMILHSDQGTVYSSKAFNDLLPLYNIARSMSRAGTPTDNAAMEAINGWMKAELFIDFHILGENVVQEVADYILFFNTQRPAYALNYLTPQQYREKFAPWAPDPNLPR